MNDKDIAEMLNVLGYGEKAPDALWGVIRTFRRRKCCFRPENLELADVVTATMIYDLSVATPKRAKNNG